MCFVSKHYIFTVVLCARNRQFLAFDDYNVSGVEWHNRAVKRWFLIPAK